MRLSFVWKQMVNNNYKVVLESKFAGHVPVTVYRSERTGLHVALARNQGPAVSLQINFATKTDSEDGLPHTLEHLVFMGSKHFPFKGGLDLLSLNAMAVGGTNAFTAQDHTGYTVKTIGAQGMQQFIPIYGDHLLNPLLTPRNYKTEVYHVTHEGVDAGVVYSEMQEHENMLECMVHRRRLAEVFPNNPCFRVETGGRLKEVRELCSLERVRNYHMRYYHMKNMWIYMCGSIDADAMLESIGKLESFYCNQPPADFKRPFIGEKVPDITRSRHESIVVRGPADDEDEGVAQIGFLGRSNMETEWIAAVEVLGTYLTKTSSAPLQKAMVLTSDPFCDSVHMELDVLPRCEIFFDFGGVPVDKLELLQDRFFEAIRESTSVEELDVTRLKYIIDKKMKKLYSKLESSVANAVFDSLAQFQLYSDDLGNQAYFDSCMNSIPVLQTLKDKPANFWANICHDLFKDNCVVVLGKPDPKVANQINKAEEERLIYLSKNLDQFKYHLLDKDCNEETHTPVLDAIECSETLQNFDIFTARSSVLYPSSASGKNGKPEWLSVLKKKDVGIDSLPFTTVVHAVDSNFIRAFYMFDLKSVSLHLRKYLMVFTDLLLHSPALVNGHNLSDKQVADLFTKEIMDNSCGMGFLQQYLHFFHLYLEMPSDEFNLLPKWTEILLNNTVFEKDKVLSIVKNLASGASSNRRDGFHMCQMVLNSLNNSREHESRWHEDVVLEKFHRSLAKQLESGDGQQILDDLNALRSAILCAPLNAHLICDPNKLSTTQAVGPNAWDFLDVTQHGQVPVGKINFDREEDAACFKVWTPAQRVIKVDSTDSSYFLQRVRCEHGYGSVEHVALILWTNYLSMMEGVLWKEVRGNGFAYGASLYTSTDTQTMTFNLYRCSRIVLAYEASRDAVLKVFDENIIDSELYESAKRGAVSTIMSHYESLKSTATLTAFNNMRDIKMEDVESFTHKIWDADMNKSFQTAKPFIKKMFDESVLQRSVVCPANKLVDVMSAFKNIEVVTLNDLQYTPS